MDSEKIYLTNEVADLLDISVPTVRNYAKALERADHEFKMRKQERLWTDIELNLVREVQHIYNAKDYPLELCFQYVVKKHYEGESVANELLAQPQYITQTQTTSPQLQALSHDVKAIIEGIGELKDRFTPKTDLLESENQSELELSGLKNENEKMNTLEFWKFKKE